MPSNQVPRDMEDIMRLSQKIKDQPENQMSSSADIASTQSRQIPAIRSCKQYGPTNLSNQAQAVLGDVYHFYERDQTEQKLILQEFKEQMESFCQRQDKRDENSQRALSLITEINFGLREKSNSSKSSPHVLSGRQLLSMMESPSQERNAEQTLGLHLSMAQRRRSQLTFVKSSSYMPQLNQWLNAKGSILLHLTASAAAEDHMTDTIVQLAHMLKESEMPIIWAFLIGSEPIDLRLVLYDITFQLLLIQPDVEITTKSPVNPRVFKGPLRIDPWTDLLRAVLTSVKKAFVVLNLSKQPSHTDQLMDDQSQIIAALTDLVNSARSRDSIIKVLVLTRRIESIDNQPMEEQERCMICAVEAMPTSIAQARRTSAQARSLTRQSLMTPVLSNE